MNYVLPGREGESPAVRDPLLLAFGLYTMTLGIAYFVQGGLMVFAVGPATELNFVGHLTEAHAGTLLGLGSIACSARGLKLNLRPVYAVIFIASILSLFVSALSTPATERGWIASVLMYANLGWAGVFSWLYYHDASKADILDSSDATGTVEKLSLFSFCLLVTASGLVWLLAPLKFATAAAGPLAGLWATYVGQTRGVSDLALGLLTGLALSNRNYALRRVVAVGLLIANLFLVAAGLFAQWSVIYTPTRWVVEGLHGLWVLGFLYTVREFAPHT